MVSSSDLRTRGRQDTDGGFSSTDTSCGGSEDDDDDDDDSSPRDGWYDSGDAGDGSTGTSRAYGPRSLCSFTVLENGQKGCVLFNCHDVIDANVSLHVGVQNTKEVLSGEYNVTL